VLGLGIRWMVQQREVGRGGPDSGEVPRQAPQQRHAVAVPRQAREAPRHRR